MAWVHQGILRGKGVRRPDNKGRVDFGWKNDTMNPSGYYIYRKFTGFLRCLQIPSYLWEANDQRGNPILKRVAYFSGPAAHFYPRA